MGFWLMHECMTSDSRNMFVGHESARPRLREGISEHACVLSVLLSFNSKCLSSDNTLCERLGGAETDQAHVNGEVLNGENES